MTPACNGVEPAVRSSRDRRGANPSLRFGLTAIPLAFAAMLFCVQPAALGQTSAADAAGGDVMRGWHVFHEKRCAHCHAVWDQGGHLGPDLGRTRSDQSTDWQLAGVMWNHIPKMLGRLEQTGLPPTTLTPREMADIFALLAFVRQLDEPGDPARGEQILRNKGCSECHDTDTGGDGPGPDLTQWGRYTNPVFWAQLMWEHAPMMEEAMKNAGIAWPKIEGADLVHIVAYLRSVGVTGEKTYLRPGSAVRGRKLFLEKKCDTCHPGQGPDLATADLPGTIGALASRMWNHSPEMARAMRRQDVARHPVSAQELADILAYVLAMGWSDDRGDTARGRRVFADKGCAQCHEREDLQIAAPSLGQLGRDATPAGMAAALWNHGRSMLDRMTEGGMSWPMFHDREMIDLLTYLTSIVDDSETPDAPGES